MSSGLSTPAHARMLRRAAGFATYFAIAFAAAIVLSTLFGCAAVEPPCVPAVLGAIPGAASSVNVDGIEALTVEQTPGGAVFR